MLGDLGPRARIAVPALVKALDKENDFPLRDEAVKALGAIAPDDPTVLRQVADLLAEESEIRTTAQKTLVKAGPRAIPVLVEKLEARWDRTGEEEILGTWGMAGPALGEIGRPALPAVLRALNDSSRRMGAAEALRVMGKQAAPDAVPALIAHAKDPDDHVRCTVFSALAAMGPAASLAIPALIAALDDPDGICAEIAASALGAIGPAARSALPALERLLQKKGSPIVKGAIERIRKP